MVSQNEAPNETKVHEKVSFVDPAPNVLYCKKFLCCTGRFLKKFLCCTSHCKGLVVIQLTW